MSDAKTQAEVAALKKYMEMNPDAVPEQFKGNPEGLLKSLKDTQAAYTKAQQELAAMKNTAETTEDPVDTATTEETVETPEDSVEPETPTTEDNVEPETPVSEDTPTLLEKLNAPDPSTSGDPKATPGLTKAEYAALRKEFATTGNLSEATKVLIKQKTGFDDEMVNDFVEGQRALARQITAKAASVVGGQKNLDAIFAWAAKTLPESERNQLKVALQSDLWETTLLGLQTKYNKANVSTNKPPETNNKPATGKRKTGSPTTIKPWASKSEYYKARKDPRYSLDPAYQASVDARTSITNVSTLQ